MSLQIMFKRLCMFPNRIFISYNDLSLGYWYNNSNSKYLLKTSCWTFYTLSHFYIFTTQSITLSQSRRKAKFYMWWWIVTLWTKSQRTELRNDTTQSKSKRKFVPWALEIIYHNTCPLFQNYNTCFLSPKIWKCA